jgi:hypothetical protein
MVITGSSCIKGTMSLYIEQLSRAGIEVFIEDVSQDVGHLDLKFKVTTIRRLAQKFSNYKRIVFSDAFDVTFYGTRQDLIRKVPTEYVLWAGEKNCYPDPNIAPLIPHVGPWRFANGGLLASSPQKFLEWADRVEQHPYYKPTMIDQQFHNMMLSIGSDLCIIDHRTELFFCLFCGYDELQFENGIPVNSVYGTHPNFLHANGKWDATEMFSRYQRSL